jgi:soluble cytochrome b562
MRELQAIVGGNADSARISATLKLIADIEAKYEHIIAGKWPKTPEAKTRAGFDYFANNIKALTIDCNPT